MQRLLVILSVSPGLVQSFLDSCCQPGQVTLSLRAAQTRMNLGLDGTSLLQELLHAKLPAVNKLDAESLKIGVPLVAVGGIVATRPPAQLLPDSTLHSIVDGTFLAQRPLSRVYKASKDGWSAVDFHEAVDGLGSSLVVARTITGKVFGGYNPNGWRSTDDYTSSSAAFLWCLAGSRVVKLPILPGGSCSVFDYATSGPNFGASDLVIGPAQAAIMGGFAGPDAEDITKSAGDLRTCKSSVGFTYDNNRSWPVRGQARLVEVEVYSSAS